MTIHAIRAVGFIGHTLKATAQHFPFPGIPIAIAVIAALATGFEKIQQHRYRLDGERFSEATTLKDKLSEKEIELLNRTILKFQSTIPLMEKDSTRFSYALKTAITSGTLDDLKPLLPIYKSSYKVLVGNATHDTPISFALSLNKWDMAKAMLKEKDFFKDLDEKQIEDLDKEKGIEHILKQSLKGRYLEVTHLIASSQIDPNTKIDGKSILNHIFKGDEIYSGSEVLRSLVRAGIDLMPIDSESYLELAITNKNMHGLFVTFLEEVYQKKCSGKLSSEDEAIFKNAIVTPLSSNELPLVSLTEQLIANMEADVPNAQEIEKLKKSLHLLFILSPAGILSKKVPGKKSINDLIKSNYEYQKVFLRFSEVYDKRRGYTEKTREIALKPKSLFAPKIMYQSELSGLRNESGSDCFFNSCLQILDQDFRSYLNPEMNPIDLDMIKKNLPETDEYREMLKSHKGIETNEAIQKHLTEIQTAISATITKKREAGSSLMKKEEITNLRTLLYDNGFIEAQPGTQEDTALVFNNIMHKLLCFTKKADDFNFTHTKKTFYTPEMLSEEESWEAITKRQQKKRLFGPTGESLYIMDADGNYSSERREVHSINHIDVGLSNCDFTSETIIKNGYTEDLGASVVRYISQNNSSPVDRKKINKVRVTQQGHEHKFDVTSSIFVCDFKRVPYVDRKIYGWGDEPEVTFPTTFRNEAGEEYILSSFSLRTGPSSHSGHYLAGRLVHSEERNLWEWHIMNDSVAERLESGAAENLDDITLPKGQATGYDVESLLKKQSTLIVYRKKSEL